MPASLSSDGAGFSCSGPASGRCRRSGSLASAVCFELQLLRHGSPACCGFLRRRSFWGCHCCGSCQAHLCEHCSNLDVHELGPLSAWSRALAACSQSSGVRKLWSTRPDATRSCVWTGSSQPGLGVVPGPALLAFSATAGLWRGSGHWSLWSDKLRKHRICRGFFLFAKVAMSETLSFLAPNTVVVVAPLAAEASHLCRI